MALVGATCPHRALRFLEIAAVFVLLFLILRICTGARHGLTGWQLLRPKGPAVLPLVLAASCIAMGIARGLMWDERMKGVEEAARSGVSVQLTVIPLEEPRPEPYGAKHTFRALARSMEGNLAGGWFGVLASVYPQNISAIVPGSPVDCRASLEVPSPAMNPGGFDYRGYLLGEGVLALAGIQGVVRPTAPTDCALFRTAAINAVAVVKSHMARAIDSTFPREDAALLKGVFLGDRGELLPEDSRDFKRSGFYRFVGICGFHVDLMFSLVERSLRRLTKRPSLSRAGAILVASCYGCLSGWSAGVIRAFVSGLLRSLAPPLRRRYHPLAGLGASALVVAWAIPFPLKNIGFLLSFTGAAGAWLGSVYAEAAGLGVRATTIDTVSGSDSRAMVSEQCLQHSMPGTGGRGTRWSFLGRTETYRLAVRLAVLVLRPLTLCLVLLPVMAFCFNEVSLVSFFLSGLWGGLAALMIPAAAVTSFVPPLGTLFGWFPHILLRGVRVVSRAVAGVPLAGVTIPAPGALEIAAFWTLLAVPLASDRILGAVRGYEDAAVFFRRMRMISALRRAVVFGSAAFLLLSAVFRVHAFVPEVTFLYVGQGDCAVVRCGSGVMVVDTGTAGAFERHVLPYLRAKGITRVDMCVISHLHADHAGGLPALCGEMTVGLVAVPPGFRDQAKALVSGAGPLPEGRIPPIVELRAGCRYRWGGAVLDVLLPGREYRTREPENESSVGFILNVGNMEMEFWGDCTSDSILWAMESYRTVLESGTERSPRIVKVPHHGSLDGYVEGLYKRASCGALGPGQPTEEGRGRGMDMISIVSVGPNTYGHPSNLVVEAAKEGGKLLRLDETGAVTLKSVFGRVVIRTFLPDPDRRSDVQARKQEGSHLESQFGRPE